MLRRPPSELPERRNGRLSPKLLFGPIHCGVVGVAPVPRPPPLGLAPIVFAMSMASDKAAEGSPFRRPVDGCRANRRPPPPRPSLECTLGC